jgi:5-methylcytosine-specific restriction endonuclease McrA
MSYRYPPRNEARKLARVDRGLYQCNHCKNSYPLKETVVDHVLPVVDVMTGFTNWEDYIERMFPEDQSRWQILCTTCHNVKTTIEKEMRKMNR